MTEKQIQRRSEIKGKRKSGIPKKNKKERKKILAIVSLLIHAHAVNADISSVNTISAVQE